MGALGLRTPIVALYDAAPGKAFEPIESAGGRACCFAYYGRWAKGCTIVVRRPEEDSDFARPFNGCRGMLRAFGLSGGYPPWMANFLTDGENAPMGEGLKAEPRLAQEFLDRAKAPEPSGDTVLLGPVRPDQWGAVRSVTFFADPDRLSALTTLAAYWSSAQDEVIAPFSSGCGLMWRDLVNQDRDRALIGGTDIAMRKYLPPEILTLTVSPRRFERMADFPDDAFLNREWWNNLKESTSGRTWSRRCRD